MTALLELRDLALRLGAFQLGPLSLALEAGDYLVLLGPSGCGKTSLLRAIAGVHRAAPGTLLLEGRDMGALAPQERRVGYVAQASDLFPHRTAGANIAFGLRYVRLPRAEREARLARIVRLLGLEPLLERWPETLSGGEARRVALARSLVVEPRVLLLDEPLSMLDPNARAEVLGALRAIHEELGTAAIHVTHEREEAWAIGGAGGTGGTGGTGERCAVMRAGRLEQVGRVDALFRAPATRFVAEFLGGANVLPARFETRAGRPSGRGRGARGGTRGCGPVRGGDERAPCLPPPGGRPVAVLDWGELALADRPPFERGYVMIRPESLAPAPPGEPVAVRGTVRSIADRGIYRELTVEVASAPGAPGAAEGNILRVHLLTGGGAGLAAGGGEREPERAVAAPSGAETSAPHACPRQGAGGREPQAAIGESDCASSAGDAHAGISDAREGTRSMPAPARGPASGAETSAPHASPRQGAALRPGDEISLVCTAPPHPIRE